MTVHPLFRRSVRSPVENKNKTCKAVDSSEAGEIRFYRANEKPFGVLSNLFRRPFEFENQIFPTAEHAYQAGKPRKEAVRAWILSAPSPSLVAMAAHGLYTWDIRPDWSKIKFDRMRAVLRAKFAQHDDLRLVLLSTGSARLVESATVDNAVNRTWGEVNGKGQNMLGLLLMELRDELLKSTGNTAQGGTVKQDDVPPMSTKNRGSRTNNRK